MANYKLFYFIEGNEDLGHLSVSKGMKVHELRSKIHGEFDSSFWNGVTDARLRLLKVDIDHTPHLGAIQDLRAGHNVQMDVTRRVDEIWPEQPNQHHLHICVRFPGVIPQKRSVPQQGDVHSQFKRAKVATQTPSSLAKSQTYVELQRDPRERILDDRPDPDYQIPPIPLLYSGFGHFLDITDGRDDVPGLADIEVAKLQMAVDTFATEMTRFYETEIKRRSKGLGLLKDIFAARRGTLIPQISASAIGSIMSDGHNVAVDGTSSIVVEFKNSPADISGVPQVQVTGFVAHLNAALVKGAYLQWRAPCLGLTIVGCDITFYALLAVDHQIRLTASVLQAQILEDAQKLNDTRKRLEDPTAAEIPAGNRRYPAISQLSVSKYATSHGPDDYLSFEICGLLDDRVHDRLLYKAKRPGVDELILIKFAQRYSIDLHHFCAKAGHAPLILGYERLPGGWYAVAMEYVESGTSITNSDLLASHRDRWMKDLRRLMDNFHEADLVHGDLRDANIICKGESVMLVDFDWGGKVGEASFPTLNLNPELLEGRVSESLRITKDDDVRVLTRTLEKFG
ncbi:hypothetical protein H4582DRAFT_2129245 [Lactarius indigo]|nr:hypothetical protein H4582DRAFT_2129245 [Lactarius indigo]